MFPKLWTSMVWRLWLGKWMVRLRKKAVLVGMVVLALGLWISMLPELSSRFKVYDKKVHSVVLEPKDGDTITQSLFGEVYICEPSVEAEIPEGPELVFPDPESTKLLKKVAGIMSSHLKEDNVRIKTEQACYMPCTNDDLPIMEAVPVMNKCYAASGHGCWGILFGPATGAAIAELVFDGHSTIIDQNHFSPARFVTAKIQVQSFTCQQCMF